MTVDTYVDHAVDRVEDEREHVRGELEAYEQFASGVESIQPTGGGGGPRSQHGGTTLVRGTAAAGGDGAQEVRELFVETVYPYSVADTDGDEHPLETIAAELGEEIATALAPKTAGRFGPSVRDAIDTAVERRKAELQAMEQALEGEAESLAAATADVESIVDWLVEANETPLSALGFDELRQRHRTLEAHRDRCRSIARRRQEWIHGTTSHGGKAGIEHHRLLEHLYRAFPTSHPVLATAVKLDECCTDCQQTVRAHLASRA